MSTKTIGCIVFETCMDFDQPLALDQSDGMPNGGILDWVGKGDKAYLFPTRQAARAAIQRTEHYRLAFGTNQPEKKNCKVVPVEGEQSQ